MHTEYQAYPTKLAGMCRSVDNYTRILIESMLYNLRQSMNARIFAASKHSRLDACDDKIYDSYLRLIRHYKRSLALYEDTADVLVSPKLKSVLEGIQSVVRSRLAICPDEISGELVENPIFLEKKRIINEEIEQFGEVFDKCSARFIDEHMDNCLQFSRSIFVTLAENNYPADGIKLAGEIARLQDEQLRDELIGACAQAIEACEERLDECGSHEEILYYHEMLDAERDILNSVIKIQIPFNRACSTTEGRVASDIVAPLIEAFEMLERSIAEIHTHFEVQSAESENFFPDELWNGNMILTVLAETNYDGFAVSIKSELTEVCHALEKDIGITAERDISNKLCARAAYEYRKRVAEHELLAVEFLKIFEDIADQETASLSQGDISAIGGGINETLQIKVESLRENKQEFTDEMAKRIKELRKQQPKPLLRELGERSELQPEIDLTVRAAFFEKYRQRMNRHISDHHDFSGKKCREFLKESLLFEMITFGEIMNYSVSRMRGDESAVEFVKGLDNAWDSLHELLNRNRIAEIAPEPRELFNGREHEVLTAEKDPEFTKGEIIKLMNPGYKQDGTVLIRANVVAAM